MASGTEFGYGIVAPVVVRLGHGNQVGMPGPRAGSFARTADFPAASLAQYPRSGVGMFPFAQTFFRQTSETP